MVAVLTGKVWMKSPVWKLLQNTPVLSTVIKSKFKKKRKGSQASFVGSGWGTTQEGLCGDSCRRPRPYSSLSFMCG